MIIARGQSKGGATQAVVLGLSRENVERLVAGQPIRVSRKTHGEGIPLGWEIILLFGETEEDIVNDLAGTGALDGAKVRHLPPGSGQ